MAFSLIVLKLCTSFSPATAVCPVSWTSGEKLRWVSDHPEADQKEREFQARAHPHRPDADHTPESPVLGPPANRVWS